MERLLSTDRFFYFALFIICLIKSFIGFNNEAYVKYLLLPTLIITIINYFYDEPHFMKWTCRSLLAIIVIIYILL